MRTEDGCIISRCLNGEPEAFGLLVDKYKTGIYAYIYTKLNDFHQAQDVAQEVFLQAFRDLYSLRRWESFVFWLYRIASTRCKLWLRTQSRRIDQDYIEDREPGMLESLSMDSYRDSEVEKSVREALDSLPEIHREVLLLHYFGGMTSRDIAGAIGISPAAVLKRLSRARSQLKKEMDTMVKKAFGRQFLPGIFTLHIAEAVKRIKINPISRTSSLPWGLSLTAGIILAVLSFGYQYKMPESLYVLTDSKLPSNMGMVEAGEIPVEILKEDVVTAQNPIFKGSFLGAGVTESSLKDLEVVNQPLGNGAALIAREERIGTVGHTAVGDLNSDGSEEIIIGTNSGVAMAFSSSQEKLWRYDCPGPITASAVKGNSAYIGTHGLVALDSHGKARWDYSSEPVLGVAIGELPGNRHEIAILMNVVESQNGIRVLSEDGNVITEFGSGIVPLGSIAVGDADGDGVYEIAVSSRENIYLFKRDGELIWSKAARECEFGNKYAETWYSPIAMSDINGDGKAEILASAYDWLITFDENGDEIWRCSGPAGLKCIAIGDIDGDGKKEVAVGSTNWDVHVIGSDGNLLWNYHIGSWVLSVAMVDIDGDGKDEVIAGGFAKAAGVFALDGDGELLWHYDVGFDIFSLTCRDIDGDGKAEVIAGSDDIHFISNTGERRWVYRSGGQFKVAADDVDGDGVAEIIAASSSVTAYKGTGEALWSCDTGQVWNLAIGDINGDGKAEVAAGCAANRAYLISSDGEIKWKHDLDWIRSSTLISDINDDSSKEVIVVDNQTFYVFDTAGKELWRFQHKEGNTTYFLQYIAVGNFNIAAGKGIVVCSEPGPWMLSSNGEIIWNYFESLAEEETEGSGDYAMLGCNSVAVADLDSDGIDEVVLLSVRGLYCFSNDGEVLWHRRSPLQGRAWGRNHLLECVDLNSDGIPEIVCGTGGGLSAYDSKGQQIWEAKSKGNIINLVTGDVDGDGQIEIVVASNEIEVFSSDGTHKFSYAGLGPMESVALGDVDGDGIEEIIAGGSGVYLIKMASK